MLNLHLSYLLLTLPLIWVLLLGSNGRKKAMVVIPLLVSLLATSFALKLADGWEEDKLHFSFELQAEDMLHKVTESIHESFTVLEAVDSFYRSSTYVSREEFKIFVTPFLERISSIQALEWVPLVTSANRLSFEKQAQDDGLKTFQFTEKEAQGAMIRRSKQAEYFPVYYVEPLTGNEKALGFDLASSPARLEALNKARDSGEPVATASITLVQEKGDQRGFLVFHPVFSQESRGTRLAGFALGVFRIGDLINNARSEQDIQNLEIEIHDRSTSEGESLLYSSLKKPSTHNERHQFRSQIEVGGRSWEVLVWPSIHFQITEQSWTTTLVLVGGLVFNVMLATFLLILTGRAARTEELVVERTAQLEETNDLLKKEIARKEQSEKALKEQRFVAFNIADDAEKAKQKERQRAEQLERKNRELDEFSYVASHDLQEPLRKLSTFCDYLVEDIGKDLNEAAAKDIQVITDAASRMQTLIQDLLDLSRVGRRELKKERVALTDCVDRALDSLSSSIKETKAIIVRNDSITEEVVGDATLLTQLFQNLIGNALKFVKGKAPRVEITAEKLNNSWTYGVKDNGIGIKAEYMQKIFSPFKRLHGKKEFSGTGIGLAICQKAVERHHGRIWVDSQPGEGSHFQFVLWETSAVKEKEIHSGEVSDDRNQWQTSHNPAC